MEYLEEKIAFLEKQVNDIKGTLQQLQDQSKPPVYLTVKQIAAKLGKTVPGINYHIRAGNLKAKGGRCKKILEQDFIVFANTYFTNNQDQTAKV